ncbi:unnamed protein product [Symbiodinium natans]|uniref:Uncharacterized protein n=1 Tax=Symbiodinium natans TaxID=878477 RepID=A0A812L7Q0_9DINO|nr:unnamed protein product [Symbiodinium natans]
MVTMLLAFSALAAAGAVRVQNADLDPVKETYEPMNCSGRHLLPSNYTVKQLWDFGGDSTATWSYFRYEITNMEPENCEKYVGFFPFFEKFLHWTRTPWNLPQRYEFLAPRLSGGKCTLYVKDTRTPRYCDVKTGDQLWNDTVPIVQDMCMEDMCTQAKSGQWHEWSTRTVLKYFAFSKKKAWQQSMPDKSKSKGFEDVFHECWQGPYGDMLGSFDDFVDRYGITTSSGTFDKKVCGCKTEDDCRGSTGGYLSADWRPT